MKVDFDNLRKRIANQYNGLYLLFGDIKDKELHDAFEMILNGLHDSIATLLCCQSDNEKINAVDFKLLPRDEDEED